MDGAPQAAQAVQPNTHYLGTQIKGSLQEILDLVNVKQTEGDQLDFMELR